MSKHLLIVAHCPSPNTKKMAQALLEGAISISEGAVSVELKNPFDCNSEDALNADAILLFTTENFGYMSGALKDFFERVYYKCLNDEHRNQAKPFCLIIKAGTDGTGAIRSVKTIARGLSWKEVFPALLCKGDFQPEFLTQCKKMGQTMLASLEADII